MNSCCFWKFKKLINFNLTYFGHMFMVSLLKSVLDYYKEKEVRGLRLDRQNKSK